MRRIDQIHTEYPSWGSRKILAKLQIEGYSIGRKLVRKLMLEMGLQTIYPKINLSKRNHKEAIVPYLLRGLDITQPSQVWSVDITYIPLEGRHMYLTAIIDWFSRYIVGWQLADTLDTENVLEALKEAIKTHGKPGIINSDQGCQFTSDLYKAFLKEQGIRQSMDGKSRWADNVIIERWFRSLKVDMIYINEYRSPRELRIAIKDYVQKYNTVRPHESLGNKTPSEVYKVVPLKPDDAVSSRAAS